MASLMEMILVLALGIGLSLPSPLGLPPRAEDPALLRAAPADTVFYLQWFGRAEPDPKSVNATEQLAAEPEIVAFVAQLRRAIRDSVLHEAAQHPLAREALDLADVALTSPGCLFVSGANLGRGEPQGGLVLKLGKYAESASTVMRKVESMMVEQLPPEQVAAAQPATHDGVRFRPLPAPGTTPVSWGVVDDYLVLAAGADVPAHVVAGLRGAVGLGAHPAFTALQGPARVARPCSRSFIDLGRLVKLGRASLGAEFGAFCELAGLDGVTALFSESGLEGNGYTSRTMLGTSGEPAGLLKLLAGPKLEAADLAVVPADATFANVLRCDPREVWAAVRDTIATMSPGDVDDLDRGVAQLETVLGISLRDDVLAHLGDVLSLWSAPSEGGLLFTGATAALSLRDGKAFGPVFARVMERITAMSNKKQRDERGRFRRGFYLQSFEHRGTTIHYVNMVGDDVPIAPAWCATGTHVMFSLFPQMLKSSIDRGCAVDTSLASRAMAIDPPTAVALSYLDAASAVETVYPLLLPLANLAAAELQRDGFDIDIASLPTQASVARHLRTEHGALQWAEGGLLLTRHGTLPFGDPVLGMLLPAAGLWTTMYRFEVEARAAAERARAMRELERRRRDK